MSIFLGILITNSLARYTQGDLYSLSISSEPDTNICTRVADTYKYTLSCDNPRTSSWKFDFWRRGYTYGIKSSTTRLALAGLLAHSLMALILIVLDNEVVGLNWRIGCAGADFRRTKGSRGTDAGISRAETWAQSVRIVEAGNGGFETRFEEDGGRGDIEMGKRVQVGKKYGYQKVAVNTAKRSKNSASRP
ncbi:hypothetical protein EAF00_008893 [Botryotinia globosa]|nr:hypothetical protein EAF00_008893 [Botryotinia globosa]